jgi:hypothetical protein
VNDLPFVYERTRPEGDYINMTDAKKLGEPLNVLEVIHDDHNRYGGEPKPRWLVRGTFNGSDKAVLVSVPKGGFSRDDFLGALEKHLEDGGDAQIRFVGTPNSNYIDIVSA